MNQKWMSLVFGLSVVWVLWFNTSEGPNQSPPNPSEGYNTKKECMEAMMGSQKPFEQLGYVHIGNSMMKDGKTLEWRCLPDTIDPRTPTKER